MENIQIINFNYRTETEGDYRVAELMTLEEVARYLRVTEKTISRMLEKRGIPATRVGHQ